MSEKFPKCPRCNKIFEPGATWGGANYCRGLYLVEVIRQNPSRSAWELSQAAAMPYTDVTRALQKLRDFGVVTYTAEEREAGGQRYRYNLSGDASAMERFMGTVERVHMASYCGPELFRRG